MNSYRKEIRTLLDSIGGNRLSALRRSYREEYLFATDLPQAADPESVCQFRDQALQAGWRTEMDHAWIHLVPAGRIRWTVPETDLPDNTEARCCASLIRRHPDDAEESDGKAEIRLLKAAEEGPQAYERVCAELHREWAAALREHRSIPAVDLPFFGGTTKC